MVEALGTELVLKPRPLAYPAWLANLFPLSLPSAPRCCYWFSPCHLIAGAVLLDLDQQTLPGVAHQVVEQMVISDQIKAEDRANVLRALLLKHRYGVRVGRSPSHPASLALVPLLSFLTLTVLCPISHPSDEKEFSFPRNISAGSLGSLLGHHHAQGTESDPHVTEPLIGGVPETRLEVDREVKGNEPCLRAGSRI